MTGLLFLILLGVGAALWFQGLWTNALTVINLLMAGVIATNFHEPVAEVLESFDKSYTYLFDFLAFWFLFAFAFSMLRAFTDALAPAPLKFAEPVEMAGRSVLALWGAWVFVSLVAFSLHMAPLNPTLSPIGAWESPSDSTFMGLNPDQHWLAFMQSRTRGALSRGKFSNAEDHPSDKEINCEVFDPRSEFIFKYHERRAKYEKAEFMRVR